jgi:two-component system NarL family response regulator
VRPGPVTDDEITVVVADDHAMFRRGLRELLQEQGLTVLGEASTGKGAYELAGALAPDIVVMDLHMPIMSGVEATRRIAEVAPSTRVLVLTVSASEDDVVDAILAGANGYLLKDAKVADILAGIRAALVGDTMISPAIATQLVERLKGHEARREAEPEVAAELSERELDVLRLLAEGKDNVEIGAELFISPRTVKNHISNILHKLRIENRIQAAVYAVKRGIV